MPVYSHLSDLQPDDESIPFSYFSLALVVHGESDPGGQGSNVSALGYIELYGSHEHMGTMMELRPQEWTRVRANMKLHTWPGEPIFGRLSGGFWFRKSTFRPQAGGQFTDTQNLYSNVTSTPSIAVHFLGASASEARKE